MQLLLLGPPTKTNIMLKMKDECLSLWMMATSEMSIRASRFALRIEMRLRISPTLSRGYVSNNENFLIPIFQIKSHVIVSYQIIKEVIFVLRVIPSVLLLFVPYFKCQNLISC